MECTGRAVQTRWIKETASILIPTCRISFDEELVKGNLIEGDHRGMQCHPDMMDWVCALPELDAVSVAAWHLGAAMLS